MPKYLVITGGSRGIGLATIQLFLENKYKVINLARNPCPLPTVINFQVDLSQKGFEEKLQITLSTLLEDAQTVTLVHNAATLNGDTVGNLEAHNFRAILEVNVVAPSVLNQLLIPKMTKGSAIIYVGSTLAEKAVPGSFSYVTSKHAVVGMMRATCQDLMDSGIHTACICPGFTDTQMLQTRTKNDPAVLAEIKALNAQGRLIEPAEIAQTIYFAANNPVLNGAVIHANLGQKER